MYLIEIQMKKFIYLLLILSSTYSYTQNKNLPYTFGKISQSDIEMEVYEKDTTADAVILYEHGSTKVENMHSVYLKTTVYRKIKILNSKGNRHADIKIYIYNDKNKNTEKLKHLKAITYNLGEPNTFLNEDKIYTKKISEHWKEVTFTFPNVKEGSVLEYQYDLESRFFFNFTGWEFQSDIPKIYSEFNASIPGNWRYNRRLNGKLKLFKNEASIEKNCFSIDSRSSADCEVLVYAMQNIPAFVEEENYSTARSNYLSKIKFELAEIFYTDGTSEKYTTSWKETDKQLKYDESMGKQIKLKSYFAKNMPSNLFEPDNEMEKAKGIYDYIQGHFTLNSDKKYIFSEVNVKKAYKDKFGSISEINMALINALKAAGLDAKIFLLSTRGKGFPTKVHPVMTDFNYVAAYVSIDNKAYLLDATDDFSPFGLLPFKVLNKYGRVLDFDKGSYWFNIPSNSSTYRRKKLLLTLNDDGNLTGTVNEINNGYFAKNKRELIYAKKEDKYLTNLENNNQNLVINSYKSENLDNLNQPFEEDFKVEINALETIGNNIYINPFVDKYSENPFKLEQRNYPVDFGYKWKDTYLIKIEIPVNYVVKSVPKNVSFQLPDNGGSFVTKYTLKDNTVSIMSRILINKKFYPTSEYQNLKEFYNQIIKTQNSLITLEKTNIH